jgi:hypothetical protein
MMVRYATKSVRVLTRTLTRQNMNISMTDRHNATNTTWPGRPRRLVKDVPQEQVLARTRP